MERGDGEGRQARVRLRIVEQVSLAEDLTAFGGAMYENQLAIHDWGTHQYLKNLDDGRSHGECYEVQHSVLEMVFYSSRHAKSSSSFTCFVIWTHTNILGAPSPISLLEHDLSTRQPLLLPQPCTAPLSTMDPPKTTVSGKKTKAEENRERKARRAINKAGENARVGAAYKAPDEGKDIEKALKYFHEMDGKL